MAIEHFPDYTQVWPSESAGQQHHSSVAGKFVIESFALESDGICQPNRFRCCGRCRREQVVLFISSFGKEKKT